MGVRSSCDMFAKNSLLAWLALRARAWPFPELLGALANAFFEKFLMLADFFLRGGQRLDHTVEALAEIFDLVAGAADPDGHEQPFRTEVMPASRRASGRAEGGW